MITMLIGVDTILNKITKFVLVFVCVCVCVRACVRACVRVCGTCMHKLFFKITYVVIQTFPWQNCAQIFLRHGDSTSCHLRQKRQCMGYEKTVGYEKTLEKTIG